MSRTEAEASPAPGLTSGNRFDRMEWAGAFGDLGTLIPFVVAYITVLGLDPFGILFSFGVVMIVCGALYKTPFPVQPMKAAGAAATTQAAQTSVVTAGAVTAATLVTGAIWLVLGLTGLSGKVANLVGRPITTGIVLGLGLNFMLEGSRFMADNWWVSCVALLATLALLSNRRIPAMFLLLLAGAVIAGMRDPALAGAIADVRPELRWPSFSLADITWSDLLVGTLVLALPQVPLTLGNAVIGITEENNRLFPHRPVTEQRVSISTGIMNLFGGCMGGIPMCHGAGGMAGHVSFGARTGGAPIILGAILLALALFFSPSIATIFKMVPREILGVILFLTGAQLALGSCNFGKDKGDRFVTLVTAGLALWNVGLAFLIGLSIYQMARKGWLRL